MFVSHMHLFWVTLAEVRLVLRDCRFCFFQRAIAQSSSVKTKEIIQRFGIY